MYVHSVNFTAEQELSDLVVRPIQISLTEEAELVDAAGKH